MQTTNLIDSSERYWPPNKRPIGESTQEMLLLAILTELRAIRAQMTPVPASAAPPERPTPTPKAAPPQRSQREKQ